MDTYLLLAILVVMTLQLLLLTVYIASSEAVGKRYAQRRREGKHHNIIDWLHYLLRK